MTPPLDYKVFVFGRSAKLVQVIQRELSPEGVLQKSGYGLYRRDWRRFCPPRMVPHWIDAALPPHLPALLQTAERLARAFPCPVRVDCYLTAAGVVFGEFCATPGIVCGIHPALDRRLGQLWS